MKFNLTAIKFFSLAIISSLFILGQTVGFAYPDGDITFYNASGNNVTAQVSSSSYGKFTLASNQSRSIAYSSLSAACSASPTRCRANFYVNDAPAGYATLNTVTGKVVSVNLSMKVRTARGDQNVLRAVVIK